ncbi:type I restriction enzyme, S subunit [Malonomonas rubra DSM 5091]|uniref:Type I restriction enzyme, S subunit n=1 Tax=Malonomonas rubra DSM 5091 TaxID=1122189 RepID=A0A1M6L900_MALRU|nr:restriction endonuclease subunit S [Malonomonas rubra]SHJ67645.1 type I restriction enzyme, S subunit [Malonomonas rubra DSM 5091]
MVGWITKPIGDVTTIINGGTPKSKVAEYWDGDVLWITPKDMGQLDSNYVSDTCRKISDKGLAKSSAKLIPANSVILSTRAPIGHLVINTLPMATNQGCRGLVPSELLDTKYLFYFLRLNVGLLNDLGSGTTFKELSKSALAGVEIPLPSLPEQKRIVAILDEAFAGIDAAVANTEKNLANARELFESYLNAVFTQKGDGWVEKKFGDADLIQIIDGDRGVNYPKKADFLDEGFCLFLNTKNVRPDGFNFDTTMFITEEKDKALRKGKLKRRDVILTTRGTIGNIAVYDDSVAYDAIRINSGMLIFRPNEKVIQSEYLFEILRSGIMKSQIERFVSGAAQPQLPIKTLVNFSIPVPVDLADQGRIVARLKELSVETQSLETVYQQKLEALVELKQSILQKAFAGELTVLPEKTLEEAVA